jgi:CheY-like chemotaxis protein
VAQAEELRRQQILLHRFEAMGLVAGLLPGGRAVVVTLPVGSEPFPTPQGPRVLHAIRFYTVGHDRIKCVAPVALFHLPLMRLVDCENAAQIENRIRAAWSERMRALERTGQWLEQLGIQADAPGGAPQWSIPLGLDEGRVRATAIEPNRVVLPSRGPLSGIGVSRWQDRIYEPGSSCHCSVDLELALTARLEALARGSRRLPARHLEATPPVPRAVRLMPALVVGARLAADRTLREALCRRGFTVDAVRSLSDAVAAFRRRSFDVVLAQARLDRADGTELVPALRGLPGILELPVALIDDRPRTSRQATAEAAGAAAYWAGPIDAAETAESLARLAATEKRRFARYECALSLSWPDCGAPGVTATIGRGGLFVRSTSETPTRTGYALHLPEAGATLRVEAEPIYRLPDAAVGPNGFGIRFCSFAAGDESTWIDYLAGLASSRSDRGPALDGRAPGGITTL